MTNKQREKMAAELGAVETQPSKGSRVLYAIVPRDGKLAVVRINNFGSRCTIAVRTTVDDARTVISETRSTMKE